MRFRKKITLATLAFASPFFIGCGDDHIDNDMVNEINKISSDRSLVDKGVTNPKTLYIKQKSSISSEIVNIEHTEQNLIVHQESKKDENLKKEIIVDQHTPVVNKKLEEIQKVKVVNNESLEKENQLNTEIEKLKQSLDDKQKLIDEAKEQVLQKVEEIDRVTKQRDDAIKVTLTMNESTHKMEQEAENLNSKIQGLMQVNSERDLLTQKKFSDISEDLEKAKELILKKDEEITKVIEARDGAQKLVDKIKIEQNKSTAKIDQLTTEIEKLKLNLVGMQDIADKKDQEIQKLIQERDDAIKVTLDLNQKSKEIEDKTINLNGTIQTLMGDLNQKEKIYQEKIISVNTELEKVVKSKDKVIKELEGENTNLHKEIKKLEEQSNTELLLSKEKMIALQSAKKLNIANSSKIKILKEKLANEISARKDIEIKILQEKKASVINSIVNSFELSKVEFKSGSAILLDNSKKLLDRVARIMQNHSVYNYKIQGHTDSSGNEKFNLTLSNKRARSVKNYLVSKGVKEDILSFEGYGSSKPIADNNTQKGRSENRRVVFEIIN